MALVYEGGKNISTLALAARGPLFLFSPHYDVLPCIYIIEQRTRKSYLFVNILYSESITFMFRIGKQTLFINNCFCNQNLTGTHANISQVVASLQTRRQQVVFSQPVRIFGTNC